MKFNNKYAIIGGALLLCGIGTIYLINNKNTSNYNEIESDFDLIENKVELDFSNKSSSQMRDYYSLEGQEFIKKLYPHSTASDFALLNIGKSIDKELNHISFKTMDDKDVNLKDLKGKKIILDVALTSCGECESETNFISSYNYDDIVFLHIFPNNNAEDVRYLYNQTNSKLDESKVVNIHGLNNFKLEDFNITNVPCKIFINEEGIVTYTSIGAVIDNEQMNLHLNRAFGDEPQVLDYLKTTNEIVDLENK